jgi:hypothetical protein
MSLERRTFAERRAVSLSDSRIGADSSVVNIEKPVATLVNQQSRSKDKADYCPYCITPFEISFVRFKFGGVMLGASCPNCGMATAWFDARSKTPDNVKKLERVSSDSGLAAGTLNLRFREVVSIVLGAVITATALRHGAHVYAGFSREEICVGALAAIPIIGLAILLFERNRLR